jgi:uncharacterized membrane protein (DUF106 family)
MLFCVLMMTFMLVAVLGIVITVKTITFDASLQLSRKNKENLLKKSFNPMFIMGGVVATIFIIAWLFNDFTDYETEFAQMMVFTASGACLGMYILFHHTLHKIRSDKKPKYNR